MNKRKWLTFFLSILTIFAISTTVMADDDDDDNHEKYEYYQKSDHDNDEYKDENWDSIEQIPITTEYWNIWSREARNNPNNLLPITDAGEVRIQMGQTDTSLYMIPQEGQLLVSSTEIAKVLGGESKYFPQSKISILTKADHELIVRAGYNAVFENRIKTPIPTVAQAYEKSVYLPVSVAANSLGYRVTWNSTNEKIIFQAIEGE